MQSSKTRARRACFYAPAFTILAMASFSTAVLLWPIAAAATLIATGTGTENVTAPNPDPGYSRVGIVNGLSGVYLRNGWVLTASHVGEGAITLGANTYAVVRGSTARFANPDATQPDLIAFKLATRPALADIALADTPANVNTLVSVIGFGANRGTPTSWNGVNGWNWSWSGSRAVRWGTNRISGIGVTALDTRAFQITFDDIPNPPAGQHEADIVNGDSGGGAFTGSGASAKLVGILFARSSFIGQPTSTSLFGNIGLIVDLYFYRDAILAVVDRPDCNDDLDEDGDGLVDYPADPGCASALDSSERSSSLVCDNGLDDDGDGEIDVPRDPGCYSGVDPSERGASAQCDNGFDDDGDLAIDFPSDSGCLHPSNEIEAPEPGVILSLGSGVLALAAAARMAKRRRSVRSPVLARRTQTSSTRSTR